MLFPNFTLWLFPESKEQPYMWKYLDMFSTCLLFHLLADWVDDPLKMVKVWRIA